ncbi:MAG: methyltransferase family protein [Candidatus Thorarchaeota archaeon]|jgi:protein-S-isoprenylcysteine O-methyltransferase Ste14
MIDVYTLRIIAAVVLVSTILLIYVVNFMDNGGEESYETKSETPFPNSIEAIGAISTFLVPMGAIILLIVFPEAVYETAFNVYFFGDTLLQILGLLSYTVGAALLIWSARHLGKFDIGRIAVAQDHVLIDTGPYARIRHPGYTGTFLLAVAVLFVSLNVLLFANLVAVAGYYLYRAKLEETFLSSQSGLGDEYLSYIDRTGRFFPKLRVSDEKRV